MEKAWGVNSDFDLNKSDSGVLPVREVNDICIFEMPSPNKKQKFF